MRKLISLALIFGTLLGISAFILVVYLMPPTDDFNPKNPYWNGLSKLVDMFKAEVLENITRLSEYKPWETALLIIGPSKPFNPEEVKIIENFLLKGGLMILADDFGAGNDVLKGMNISLRFSGYLLADTFQGEKIGYMPRAKIYLEDMNNAVLNYATVIEKTENKTRIKIKVIAYSSPLSFLDINYNKIKDEKEPRGPFPVVMLAYYEKGSLILISDSSIFINSMIELGDNLKLLKKLLGDRLSLIHI